MEQIKQIAKKIFFKPYGLTILIAIPSYLFVAYVLVKEPERSTYSIAAYALGSYALALSGTAIYRMIKIIKSRITRHRIWKKYRMDFVFRTKITLIPNTAINVIFAMLKLILGFYYQSIWMIALGIYYVCLLLLRVSLLYGVYHHSIVLEQKNERKVTRLYGFYLLLLDIALGGIVLYSIYQGAQYSYPGYLIYAMAAYTFYAVIVAGIGFYKNHRKESPIIVTVNVLKLTTALVALFALETAMLNTFGGESSRMFQQRIIAVTGFVIVAVILGMALYLMIHFHLVNQRKANTKENTESIYEKRQQ